MIRARALAPLALVLASCGEAEQDASHFSLAPFEASQAPLSEDEVVTLASETTACVIESYEVRIHCIDRTDGPVAVFGRQGQGPGEFRYAPVDIVRGPDGTIGVFSAQHMLVFETAGTLISEMPLPSVLLFPSGPFGPTLVAAELQANRESGRMRITSWRHLEMDVASGEILWERVFPADMAADAGCPPGVEGVVRPEGAPLPPTPEGMSRALTFPDGGMVFTMLCRGQMLFVADRDDDGGTLVQAPTYVRELPNQRDVERYLDGCGPGFPSPGSFRPTCALDVFRRTPKAYASPERHRVDDVGRLWVLTNRDREEFSHLDVFRGPEYLGTVRVRHRGVGFDVLGSTLAVLVERPVGEGDADGLPDRAIDWYDISGLEFGLAGQETAVGSP
ncbi:MAG: hypothetical protein F4Z78_09365 [Gammaproteobacteria bacterium]|nr:hypothetical protein [Gammaproteobacteria bacterium]